MTFPRTNISTPVVLSAIAACLVALAACGSSSPRTTNAASVSPSLRFADCMRAHGVPNFPDPGSGGGIQITPGSGIDPQSPAFESAQNACVKLLPGGGPPREASETRKLAMLRLAQCMRRHGLASFPDPTSTPPTLGGGIGVAFGSPGAFIAVPQSLMKSPAFRQAAAACGFPGLGIPGAAKRTGVAG